MHECPQLPQLAVLVLRLVSQPLAALLSQLPYPVVHAPMPHVPIVQVAPAFG
jgi:hypothetical protein